MLSEHRDAIYGQLFASGKAFRKDVNARLADAGLGGICTGAGPIVSFDTVIENLLPRAATQGDDDARLSDWRRALYDRGIVIGRTDLLNLSTAHTERDLSAIAPEIAAAAAAFKPAGPSEAQR